LEEIEVMKEEAEQQFRAERGLDGPYVIRNVRQVFKAIRLDLGNSLRGLHTTQTPFSHDAKDVILEALPNTLYLFVTTTIICVFLSLWIGVKKAQKFNSPFDKVTSGLTMFFIGIPSWLLGGYLVMFFYYYLDILPFGRLNSIPGPEGQLAWIFDRFKHMLIPIMSVTLVRFWSNAFLIRNLLLEPLQQEYITSARGRGIPERKILFGHALRVASPGIITLSLSSLVNSIAGDIIAEKYLAWPGIGSLFWNAVSNAGDVPRPPDIPVLLGILTILTAIVCLSNLLLDILYAILDPRIRY
jgi:peptide/nickel transport system permease protein